MAKNNFMPGFKAIVYAYTVAWSLLAGMATITRFEHRSDVVAIAAMLNLMSLILAINWWGDES